MRQPPWYSVTLGDSADATLRATFGDERTGIGWPSYRDAIDIWLPEAIAIIPQTWSSAAPANNTDGIPMDVRQLAMKAHISFPEADLVIARPSEDDASLVKLVIIGVSFDHQRWEERRIAGLNE